MRLKWNRVKLTEKERQIILFLRQLESQNIGQHKAVRPVLLTRQQVSVLQAVNKEPYGIKPENFSKLVLRFGYKRPNAVGGFFKGKNASLRRVKLPIHGEMVFLTEHGKFILENNTTPPLPRLPKIEKEPLTEEPPKSPTEEMATAS